MSSGAMDMDVPDTWSPMYNCIFIVVRGVGVHPKLGETRFAFCSKVVGRGGSASRQWLCSIHRWQYQAWSI